MTDFFSFQGRTSRLGYWRIQLISTALAAGIMSLGFWAIIAIGPAGGALLVAVPLIYVGVLASIVRRLHDRGKTIWWSVLFVFGPLSSLGLANLLAQKNTVLAALASLPFTLAGLALFVWGWVEVGFLRGDPLPNRFGDRPPR